MSLARTSTEFGLLPSGESVEAYTLTGEGGLSLQAITYGGIVTGLQVPDRRGRIADLVLGFDQLDAYLRPHPYFGAIAGRVAGRITNARFHLDGRNYLVAANEPPHHLHGGVRGFDKRNWQATMTGEGSLRLSRVSPDGEEGYPGNVTVHVTYTVTAANEFIIDMEAASDRLTPCSLTHHSYFNLAGEGSGSIEAHELQIFADEYVPADESFGLTGRREPVTAGNDFRAPRRLGDAIPHLHGRHGDLYLVRRDEPEPRCVPAARLIDRASGRALTVSTTEQYIQIYTGVFLDGTLTGKSGRPYHSHGGLCLECEGYPDGANEPSLGSVLLRPGHTLRQRTVYAFSTV